MKTEKLKSKRNGEGSTHALVEKAQVAQRLADAARKNLKLVKAEHKLARKSFKQAKKAAKRARRAASAALRKHPLTNGESVLKVRPRATRRVKGARTRSVAVRPRKGPRRAVGSVTQPDQTAVLEVQE